MVIMFDKKAILCLYVQITPIYWIPGIIVFHGDASNIQSKSSNVSSERTCSVYAVFFFNKEPAAQNLFTNQYASTPYFTM